MNLGCRKSALHLLRGCSFVVPTEVSEGRGRPSAPVRLYVGMLNTNSTFSCHWQDARAFIGLLGDFRNNRPHAGESDNFTQGPNFADPATCILTAKHYKLRDLIEARNNIKSPSRISKARPKSSDISSMSHPGLAKSTNFPLVMYDGLNNLVLFSNSCAEYY